MFRALLFPSSGACDYGVELPHWPFRPWLAVCWRLGAVRLEWCPGCRLKHNKTLNCLFSFCSCIFVLFFCFTCVSVLAVQ
jgi:hypothetical protein